MIQENKIPKIETFIPTETHLFQDPRILSAFKKLAPPVLVNNMILETDKNMGTCIISKTKYEELKNNILENKKEFKQTESPEIIITQYKSLIRHSFATLPVDILPSIEEEQIQTFTGIPKVHKSPIKLRPIVNACSCYTTKLAKIINCILTPLLTLTNKLNPLNVKNSDTFINKIKAIPPEEVKKLTIDALDFESMYTNIPTDKLLANIRSLLNKFRHHVETDLKDVKKYVTAKNKYDLIPITNAQIMKMITIYLRFNYVKDGKKIFKQLKGIPTGGNCSPLLANLYLSEYELNFKDNNPEMFEKYKNSGRYLDDLAALTSDILYSVEKVNNMIYMGDMILATTHENIPFKPRNLLNQRKIFMDLILELEKLATVACIGYRLFRKEGNAYNYPHAKSHLPKACKTGFIKAEFNRIRARCKYNNDINIEDQTFINNLIKRGYSRQNIIKIRDRNHDPKEIIKQKHTCKWIVTRYTEIFTKTSLKKMINPENMDIETDNKERNLAFKNFPKIRHIAKHINK